jgi:hypothetical protein
MTDYCADRGLAKELLRYAIILSLGIFACTPAALSDSMPAGRAQNGFLEALEQVRQAEQPGRGGLSSEEPPSENVKTPLNSAAPIQAPSVHGIVNASSFKGDGFSLQVNACLAAVAAGGGGTCDARDYPATNYASQSITVGDGLHSVTLILPTGTIIFADGKQLIYRSHGSIVGQGLGYYKYHGLPPGSGSIINCAATITVCVAPYHEPSNVLEYARLADFSIQSTPSREVPSSGSVGLAIGGGVGGADVASSRFEYLNIGGFDVGTRMGGAYGCTCYNEIDQVYSTGKSYGVSTVNVSKFFGDVNSNSWIAGSAWGAVGLSDVGGSKNRWIGIDIEGAKVHGIVLGGYGTSVISPYEEGNGCDLIDGTDDMVVGPLAYGGGAWQPCSASKSTTGFWMGPDASPKTIGTTSGLVFGSPKMYDDGHNSQFTLLTGSALNLKYSGNQVAVYGHDGHAPLSVGNLEATSGITSTGRSSFAALSDPSPPTLSAIGGTGTTYTYYVIGYDRNGGMTLPSDAATVSGPGELGTVLTATPRRGGSGYSVGDVVKIVGNGGDGHATAKVTSVGSNGAVTGLVVTAGGTSYASSNYGNLVVFSTEGGKGIGLTVTIGASYIEISPRSSDGVYCVDVLKNDTKHMLPSTIGDRYGCNVHNALPKRLDFGQATVDYAAPVRNNTGDLSIAGQAAAAKYCFEGSSVCWTTTAGPPAGACVNGSIDSSTTDGALYVCQAKQWVEK